MTARPVPRHTRRPQRRTASLLRLSACCTRPTKKLSPVSRGHRESLSKIARPPRLFHKRQGPRNSCQRRWEDGVVRTMACTPQRSRLCPGLLALANFQDRGAGVTCASRLVPRDSFFLSGEVSPRSVPFVNGAPVAVTKRRAARQEGRPSRKARRIRERGARSEGRNRARDIPGRGFHSRMKHHGHGMGFGGSLRSIRG